MSRLTDLIQKAKAKDPQLGADIEREFRALSSRLSFGLNFERHRPEAVELPGRPVRRGDKVRVLAPRGSTAKGDQRLWLVKAIHKANRTADLEGLHAAEEEVQTKNLEDLVVVAEFRDTIYPGLVSTGKVSRGGDKPWHTVINGENFHALKALTWTHRGKVDAVYIDPPYNTGAKDWKYNNDYVEGDDLYRHSKWLAMIERRLLIAKELMNPADSVLIVTIDEKEYLRLGLLLEQTFAGARIQMVTTVIKPEGAIRVNEFSRTNEFIFFVMIGKAAVAAGIDNMYDRDGSEGGHGVEWRNLRRRERANIRGSRPNQFYAVFVDEVTGRIHSVGEPIADNVPRESIRSPSGTTALFPLGPRSKEMIWSIVPSSLRELVSKGFARWNGTTIQYLTSGTVTAIANEEAIVTGYDAHGAAIAEFPSAKSSMPKTVWSRDSHNPQSYGTKVLSKLLPGRNFPFPKSLYAVEDALRFFVANKPEAIILDFFSGSGTTAHAVMRLNEQDGGKRQAISVTNNEVGADEQSVLRKQGLRPGDAEWEKWGICDYITKPRVRAAIIGKTPDGESIDGEYPFGKTVEQKKLRNFKHIGFAESSMFDSATKKKQLVALIDGLPQNLVKDACPFIVSEEHKASILFDSLQAEDWLEALEGQEHITDFYIVTPVKKTFDELKSQVMERLGPLIVKEVEKVPMANGCEDNAEFFTLTYETPLAISYQTAFARIAPLLWLRAGGVGRRVEKLPVAGWDVADAYGLLVELDKATEFLKAARKAEALRIAYIVTDDERRFQALARRLPEGVEVIRLYESYLTNFAFANGDDA